MSADTIIVGGAGGGVLQVRGPGAGIRPNQGLSVGSVLRAGAGIVGGLVSGNVFDTSPDIEIQSQAQAAASSNGECKTFRVDRCTGELVCIKPRKRRRRLLTCGDKADIAFIVGSLGKGALGQTAISSMLARCN